MERTSKPQKNRLKAIEVVISGILLEKALELGKAFVTAAASTQNLDTRMAAWAGGTKVAQEILEKLNRDLGASGVKIDAMGDAFVKLKASGLTNDQAVQTVENIVSGIAALGGKDIEGKLEAAATSFQRFTSKGVVGSRELNAVIGETGITVKDLADAGGESVKKFYEDLQSKSTRAITFLDAFNKAAQLKFGGFVHLLGSEVGGALNKFQNDVTLAFGAVAKETGADNAIVAGLRLMDEAVLNFLKSIGKKDIDDFIKKLGDIATEAYNVVRALIHFGGAAADLAVILSDMLSSLPPEATEYGILGYMLFGRKGAAALMLIGAMDAGALRNSAAATHDVFGNSVQNDFEKRFGSGATSVGPLAQIGQGLSALAGKPTSSTNAFTEAVKKLHDEMKKVAADAEKLSKFKFSPNGITDGATGSGQNALDSLRAQSDSTLSEINGKINLEAFKNSGDELNAALQGARNTTQKTVEQLLVLKKTIDDSKLSTAEKGQYDLEILGLMMRATSEGQKQLYIIRDIEAAKQKQLALTVQISHAEEQIFAIETKQKIAGLSSGSVSFAQGLSAGQAMMQAAKDQAKYTLDILNYRQKINALETQNASGISAEKIAANNQMIGDLREQISLTQRLASVTSASAALMSEAYKQLGQTLENDVSNGIAGIINGTETWRDLGRQVFGDLVSWAVKYMLQLIEIQAIKLVMGDSGDLTGAAALTSAAAALAAASIPLDGSAAALMAAAEALAAANSIGSIGLGGFAKGGVFDGQVTPFANGGITTGPTLFGLMGEAGTEAVMPLTRIGGKLGVHASGGGGRNYHITVQAIDTQSGLQFIGQHIKAIDAGLHQSRMLNGRAGHY